MSQANNVNISLEQAKLLFPNIMNDSHLQERNAEKYLQCLEYLGNKWLLAKKVTRKELK